MLDYVVQYLLLGSINTKTKLQTEILNLSFRRMNIYVNMLRR